MENLTKKQNKKIELSVVVPFYNEEDNIPILYRRLKDVVKKMQKCYELIFVDDGSHDDTFRVLESLYNEDHTVKVIKLRRNFGQTLALRAGFEYAKGEIIVSLDGDLQHAPEDIPLLVNKLEEGFDIVAGWRKERNDKFLTRRLPSSIANKLIRFLSGVPIHDFGTTLRAYRNDIIKKIKLYGELHRFIPALASDLSAKITEVPIQNPSRGSGKSNYGLMRTIRVILDLITVKFILSYSKSPMQIFGLLGVFFSGLGFMAGLYLSIKKILFHVAIGREPLLILSVLLMVVGVQLISTGLLGEMIMRLYYESHDRQVFIIDEILDKERNQNT